MNSATGLPPHQKIRLQNLLLYIFASTRTRPVGLTVLHKLLYFIDFDHYEIHEVPFIGGRYTKKPYGPMLDCMDQFLAGMAGNSEISCSRKPIFDYDRTEWVNNIEPDMAVFTKEEVQHIDWELERLSRMSARAISDFSHTDIPWMAANEEEELDYELVFYRDPDHSGTHTIQGAISSSDSLNYSSKAIKPMLR